MNTAALRLPILPTAGLAASLARWRQRAAERRRMRAAQQELSTLDTRGFNDLGMGRSEIDYWLARPADGSKTARS